MPKYVFKNTVLAVHGKFVSGFSLKTQRVYFSANPSAAKRFTAVNAQKFIAEHASKDPLFTYTNIQILLLRPGQSVHSLLEDKYFQMDHNDSCDQSSSK